MRIECYKKEGDLFVPIIFDADSYKGIEISILNRSLEDLYKIEKGLCDPSLDDVIGQYLREHQVCKILIMLSEKENSTWWESSFLQGLQRICDKRCGGIDMSVIKITPNFKRMEYPICVSRKNDADEEEEDTIKLIITQDEESDNDLMREKIDELIKAIELLNEIKDDDEDDDLEDEEHFSWKDHDEYLRAHIQAHEALVRLMKVDSEEKEAKKKESKVLMKYDGEGIRAGDNIIFHLDRFLNIKDKDQYNIALNQLLNTICFSDSGTVVIRFHRITKYPQFKSFIDDLQKAKMRTWKDAFRNKRVYFLREDYVEGTPEISYAAIEGCMGPKNWITL